MSSDLANKYASSFYQATSRSQAMQWLQRADAGDHDASVLQHVHTRATRRIPGLDRFKAFKGLFNSEADQFQGPATVVAKISNTGFKVQLNGKHYYRTLKCLHKHKGGGAPAATMQPSQLREGDLVVVRDDNEYTTRRVWVVEILDVTETHIQVLRHSQAGADQSTLGWHISKAKSQVHIQATKRKS